MLPSEPARRALIKKVKSERHRNYINNFLIVFTFTCYARRAGSDGSMSASGSAGSGFDRRRGSKFSFENFEPRG